MRNGTENGTAPEPLKIDPDWRPRTVPSVVFRRTTAAQASLEMSGGRSRIAPVTFPSIRSGRKTSGTWTSSTGAPFVATLIPSALVQASLPSMSVAKRKVSVVVTRSVGSRRTSKLIGTWPGLAMRLSPTTTTDGPLGSTWTTVMVRTAASVSFQGSVYEAWPVTVILSGPALSLGLALSDAAADCVAATVGDALGDAVGTAVGTCVGGAVVASVGVAVGSFVGLAVTGGVSAGVSEACSLGIADGDDAGDWLAPGEPDAPGMTTVDFATVRSNVASGVIGVVDLVW